MLNDKKVVGLICECNPFHEGHKRILNEAKKYGDIIVCIMSGNFVERGEPAVYDKYDRTTSLIKNDADIVIELPMEFVLSSAHYFAMSGVAILNKLSFVDYLIFGSKINDIDKLSKIANTDIKKFAYKNIDIKEASFYNYPKYMEKIYGTRLSPNDILAVEYLRAINELKSKIKPICIERKNDLKSATTLRNEMKNKITIDDFSLVLNYKLLSHSNTDNNNLNDINCMTKDLSNAILNNVNKYATFDSLSQALNTKNRTLANIKRIFLNIIFDITKKQIKKLNFGKKVNYIRILGIKKSSMNILKSIKIPYLLSYAPSSYKSLIKNFKNQKVVKVLKNKTYKPSTEISNTIFASNLYYKINHSGKNEVTEKVVIL